MSMQHMLDLTCKLAFDLYEEIHNHQTNAPVQREINLYEHAVQMVLILEEDGKIIERIDYYFKHVHDIQKIGIFGPSTAQLHKK